ncbi:type IV pilus biogenesis/stability protein PilW [Caldimonas caldifontis]|uniref:Type IV pilus biogenesis/stability protein PilW n=1 Tax=Caldimonas caldifontis TaxID=1452508 RepID=A0A2S5SY36_9BURK|nr:type IV pilus biogenesis/stability protein PilW [Caldimonas caldifontis]PPE67660.1 type IV pilus biogenesis/stability protein PilW [Caldimonas caldifontis]
MSVRKRPIGWWWVALLGLTVLMGGCASTSPTTGGGTQAGRQDETEVQRRARIRFDLAVAYYAQGQHATALAEIRQALALQPNLPGAHNLAGLIHSALGQDPQAEESFRIAMQQDGADANAIHNYGWFLCQRRRYAEAFTQFNRAIELPTYREVPRTLVAKGVCQANAGLLAEAEKTLSRAYQMDTGNPVAAMNLALVLYRQGEYERARFYVRRVNAVPELVNAETLWLAARIEHRLGNRGGVNEFGRELLQRFPQSREAANFERGRFDD